MWFGSLDPPTWVFNTWRDAHPGWQVRVWRERDYLSLKGAQLHTQYFSTRRVNERADLARLDILYVEGGVYIDADIVCIQTLDALFAKAGIDESIDAVFVQEKRGLVSNAVIASKVESRAIKVAIADVQRAAVEFTTSGVWERTGPGVLTRVTEAMLHEANVQIEDREQFPSSPTLRILPYYTFYLAQDLVRSKADTVWTPEIIHKDQRRRDWKYANVFGIYTEWVTGLHLWMGTRHHNYQREWNQVQLRQNIQQFLQHLKETNTRVR